MYTPRVRFRSTAYQSVVASLVPWILCQGRAGGSTSVASLASISCLRVAT